MAVIGDVLRGRKVERIMRDTWGHTDARPGVRYRGTIVFAEGAFGGDRIILSAEFGNAGYGPWFYEGIHDWLFEQTAEPGNLYRFDGCYRLCRGGAHEFAGVITALPLPTS